MAWDLSRLTDTSAVRRFIAYHEHRDAAAVRAGLARLCELEARVHDDPQDPLVKETWRAVAAIEEVRFRTHGQRRPAARTRRKIVRDGAPATLASLAVREPPAAGFRFLIDAGLVDLTAEAIALRYPHRFAARAIEAARRKLAAEGFDLDTAEAVK